MMSEEATKREFPNFDFTTGEVLLINKPYTWTSFDVVGKIRNSFKPLKLKVGHAGTLDPLATGLLIICTGKLTKQIDTFQAEEKEYIGTFTLGSTTPSYDLETEVDQTFDTSGLTEKDILEIKNKSLNKIIVTTEKDYVRLKGSVLAEQLFYLPIKSRFLVGADTFNKTIMNYVGTSTRDCKLHQQGK
ncbi:MAG: tetraacyldisaccharide 4'-kinase [Bacteroidetes bacterium]|nr:tetraacyldisaccharide 4'-kinase [Bacteroidota bacterium]